MKKWWKNQLASKFLGVFKLLSPLLNLEEPKLSPVQRRELLLILPSDESQC